MLKNQQTPTSGFNPQELKTIQQFARDKYILNDYNKKEGYKNSRHSERKKSTVKKESSKLPSDEKGSHRNHYI